ncbi:C40 family peptidase [Actinotalea caeni]|uniref:C40 family peptidase n=1 Tax=Actinotalea caeni TaxID=1348467 RepID=UPI0023DA5A1F|nr:C40 family peptidase [Actinotalea caeni]
MSIGAITERIGRIEATLAQLRPAPPVVLPTAQTERTTTGGALSTNRTAGTFATELASALAATGPATATSPGTTSASVPTVPTLSSVPALPALPTATGGVTGDDVVTAARAYLGVPYVWGGESLAEGGFDCSGLVQHVFGELGVDLPRTAREQMRSGDAVGSLAEARPGDLIVTRGGGHIMIYIGDGRVLHAPRPGQDVQIRELFETDADITAIRRVVPPGGGTDLLAAAARTALTGASA